MQLTKNFAVEEFTNGRLINDIPVVQMNMLKDLVTAILQPIRDALNVPCTVTSGIRVASDYQRLLAQGLHPSETSDHYYGQAVLLQSVGKVNTFGPLYNYSVGAVDFIPKMDLKTAFDQISTMVRNAQINVGQLIYESGGGKYWIHVSNPQWHYFAPPFINTYYPNRPKILISSDAGKTYQVIA